MLSMILDAFGSVSDSEFWVDDVLLSFFKVKVVEVEPSSSLSGNEKPTLLSHEFVEEQYLGFGSFLEIEVLGLGFGAGSYTSESFGLPQPQPLPALGVSMD